MRRPTLTQGAIRGFEFALSRAALSATERRKFSNETVSDFYEAREFLKQFIEWKRTKKENQMGNVTKAMRNEKSSDYWILDSIESTKDMIEKQLGKIASDAVEAVLLSENSTVYLGVSPSNGEGLFLSLFIDDFVLYFKADDLFEPDFSDKGELEEMLKWHKESVQKIEKEMNK